MADQIESIESSDLSGVRLELISFISTPDSSFTYNDPQILFNNFLQLLEDEFCTKQDYKEFLEFHTKMFISTNL